MYSTPLRTATAATLALSLLSQIPTVASMNAMTYVGCFNSSTPLDDQGTYTYQTSGYCQGVCYGLKDAAMGMTGGSNCACGPKLPAKADLVDDSKCDSSCQGYPSENCGGNGFWSVYKTGLDNNVEYYDGGSSSSSTSKGSSSSTTISSTTSVSSSTTTGSATSTTDGPTLITSEAPGRTVVITLSASNGATSTSEANKKSGGSSTAGIAAGVVVGVVALLAIAGGLFFWFRQKKRQQIEDEYSKRSQAQDFGATAMTGGGRGVSIRSANDARLDPEAMLARRLSDGSIADEQDYSRRILKVRN